jgi:hypothetical protein
VTYPKPKPNELRAAFDDHKVNWTQHPECNNGRDAWANGLRAVTMHHTAGKNSADYLASFNWGGCNAVINHGGYNGRAHDGRAVIICWGSAWHSGMGGPWKGVAGEDSLHLVSWGMEVESLGDRPDMTDKQIETSGRIIAALVELGVPIDHTHRHADWTDATGPVTGPLRVRPATGKTTKGRKIDTNKHWYPTDFWVEQGLKYALPTPAVPKPGDMWDGKVPPIEAIYAAEAGSLRSPAAFRLACRLYDLGFMRGVRPKAEQGYPVNGMRHWQADKGYAATGKYGPRAHEKIFFPVR